MTTEPINKEAPSFFKRMTHQLELTSDMKVVEYSNNLFHYTIEDQNDEDCSLNVDLMINAMAIFKFRDDYEIKLLIVDENKQKVYATLVGRKKFDKMSISDVGSVVKGGGTLLMQYLEKTVKARGIETMILTSYPESIGFYEKMGFKPYLSPSNGFTTMIKSISSI